MRHNRIDIKGIDEFAFFGCSFTTMDGSDTGYKFTNFRKLIENNFKESGFDNIVYTNHSKTGLSNQEIINNVYWNIEKTKNEKPPDRTLFIIQTTFLDRLGLYYDLENKFVSVCKREGSDDFKEKILINFYNDWLKYFYSRTNALLEFQKQIDLLCSYLDSLNVKYILIGIDESLDLIESTNFFGRNNFLKFENTYSFYGYSIQNKLRISDIIDSSNKDFHFNQKGHDILTKEILNKIVND